MKNKMDKLDEILKKKLANEQFSFNDDDWNAAFSQIKNTKKKRGFWFWMSGLILLLAATTLVFSVSKTRFKIKEKANNIKKTENVKYKGEDDKTKGTLNIKVDKKIESVELEKKNIGKGLKNKGLKDG